MFGLSNIKFECTKVKVCVLILGVLYAANLAAQEPNYREPTGTNNWYIELGGAAFAYSLNYEKILYRKNKIGWTGRVGFAVGYKDGYILNQFLMDAGAVYAPFSTSFLLGSRDRKERLELGLGFTLIAHNGQQETVPTGVLGIKVIETNKVCFRVGYTPYLRNGVYYNWFGVSIGRNFSMGK